MPMCITIPSPILISMVYSMSQGPLQAAVEPPLEGPIADLPVRHHDRHKLPTPAPLDAKQSFHKVDPTGDLQDAAQDRESMLVRPPP